MEIESSSLLQYKSSTDKFQSGSSHGRGSHQGDSLGECKKPKPSLLMVVQKLLMMLVEVLEKPEVEPPEKDDTVQDDIDLEVPEVQDLNGKMDLLRPDTQ